VHEGARLLREHHVGALVVIDSRQTSRPLGSSPTGHGGRGARHGIDPAKVTVGDLMSGSIVSVNASEGVLESIRLMQSEGVRRVVVVDNAGHWWASCRSTTWFRTCPRHSRGFRMPSPRAEPGAEMRT